MDVGAGSRRRARRVVGRLRKLSDWKRFTYKENSRGTFARTATGRTGGNEVRKADKAASLGRVLEMIRAPGEQKDSCLALQESIPGWKERVRSEC
jgi:hypothetical protein